MNATYYGAVGLSGAAAACDLNTKLLLDFSGLTGGGSLARVNFETDIDTLADRDDLHAVSHVAPVPLPAGLPLLLCGLAGLGMLRRRRRNLR